MGGTNFSYTKDTNSVIFYTKINHLNWTYRGKLTFPYTKDPNSVIFYT